MQIAEMCSTLQVQKRIMDNKISKGFNTTNIDREFCLAYGELGEAFDAYRRGKENMGEELADTVIYIMALADMMHVDLGEEINNKLEINESRVYLKNEKGVLEKTT